ncbi:hypothetical protein DXU04_25055 [Bradyrhizobium diazoefficiens]
MTLRLFFATAIAQRTRDRILGHASDVRGRYGRKGLLDPEIAAMIEKLEPPVVKRTREVFTQPAKQKRTSRRRPAHSRPEARRRARAQCRN